MKGSAPLLPAAIVSQNADIQFGEECINCRQAEDEDSRLGCDLSAEEQNPDNDQQGAKHHGQNGLFRQIEQDNRADHETKHGQGDRTGMRRLDWPATPEQALQVRPDRPEQQHGKIGNCPAA